MVWMGMYSQAFLPSIGASNSKILTMVDKRSEQQVKAVTAEAARAD